MVWSLLTLFIIILLTWRKKESYSTTTSNSSHPIPSSALLTTSSPIIQNQLLSYSLPNAFFTIIPKTVSLVRASSSPLTLFSKSSGLSLKVKKKSLKSHMELSSCVHSSNPNNFTVTMSRILKNGKSNYANSWISSTFTNFLKLKKDSAKVTLLLYIWVSNSRTRKKWPSKLLENKQHFHSKTVDKLYSIK